MGGTENQASHNILQLTVLNEEQSASRPEGQVSTKGAGHSAQQWGEDEPDWRGKRQGQRVKTERQERGEAE